MSPRIRHVVDLLKETFSAWSDDKCSSRAAAVSYYTAFSLAPMLVIATAIASLLFEHDTVVATMLDETRRLMGPDGADFIGKLLTAAAHEKNRGIAAIVAGITLLAGATTAFAELKDNLDAIWRVPKTEDAGVKALVRARLLSFGLVASLGFLLLVSLIANAALEAFSDAFSRWFGFAFTLIARIASWAFSTIGVCVVFALIFKLLPTRRPSWKSAWHGALFTTVLFLLGRAAIGLYLGNTATASSFGAAGSLAVLLVWVYYSAIIFFLGAEYTRIASTRAGTVEEAPPKSGRPAPRRSKTRPAEAT